jgi:hypothetical protein
VVRPEAAAAGGQAQFCVDWEDRRKRPQPEQQNQEHANYSPHRGFIPQGEPDVRAVPEKLARAGKRRSDIVSFLSRKSLALFAQCQNP